MQLTTLWRTPKGSLSKLSTTASCHQPWLRLLRQENQQNQQQKVKSSKANGSATNAKAFCWSWHDRGCAMFLLNLLNGWLDHRFLSSTIQHATVYQCFISHIKWVTVICRYIMTYHVICSHHWAGSALSHVTAVTARREGGAGEHGRCRDMQWPWSHRCSIDVHWSIVV